MSEDSPNIRWFTRNQAYYFQVYNKSNSSNNHRLRTKVDIRRDQHPGRLRLRSVGTRGMYATSLPSNTTTNVGMLNASGSGSATVNVNVTGEGAGRDMPGCRRESPLPPPSQRPMPPPTCPTPLSSPPSPRTEMANQINEQIIAQQNEELPPDEVPTKRVRDFN